MEHYDIVEWDVYSDAVGHCFCADTFSSGAVMIFLAGAFVVFFTIIWSILMVEFMFKVTVDNGVNHWMVWINSNVIYI